MKHLGMKHHSISLLASLLLAVHAPSSALELLGPQAADLAAPRTLAAAAPGFAAQDQGFAARARETVAVSWASSTAVEAPRPYLTQSRESYRKVSGAQLNAGIELETSSPRALVRLQPLGEIGQRDKDALMPQAMQIRVANGKTLSGGDGMEAIVTADKLAKADLPFAPGTSTFRIAEQLGAGSFQLIASGLQDEQEYLINVVEADSPLILEAQTAASHYLHGQQLAVVAQLRDSREGGKKQLVKSFQAELVSPAGRVFPLRFMPIAGGSYRALLKLDAQEVPTPGMWEVRMHSQSQIKGQNIQRSARFGFPVALPVARLTGEVQLQNGKPHLGIQFGVSAASPGRYEVRGMLYGTVNGSLQPLGVAQAAQWLEVGRGEIALQFDPSLLKGASAPFEVRDLGLLDQSRIAVLHRQARALVLDASDIKRADLATGQQAQAAQGVQVFLPARSKDVQK